MVFPSVPSRSPHNCEKEAFSDTSSRTTSNRVPELLSAWPRDTNARKKIKGSHRMIRVGGIEGPTVLLNVLKVEESNVFNAKTFGGQLLKSSESGESRSLLIHWPITDYSYP